MCVYLPVQSRFDRTCIQGFVRMGDALAVFDQIESPIVHSAPESTVIPENAPFQHVSTGMGAVSVQVKGSCLCLNPESLGCVDVDVEARAVSAFEAEGSELGFFRAKFLLWLRDWCL